MDQSFRVGCAAHELLPQQRGSQGRPHDSRVRRELQLPSDVMVLRYSDGMRWGDLGLIYNLLLQLDELYSSPIDGLPEQVRTKMYQVFTNRWTGYHTPIMTVVFKPHPEFCRRDTDKGVDSDFNKVITDLSRAPGAPSPTLMKLQYEEFWITCKTGPMGHCDDG